MPVCISNSFLCKFLTNYNLPTGYTIYAQVALFCNIRDVPFSFMACSSDCLWATVSTLERLNESQKAAKNFSKLPNCHYKLKFVQDLEEFRKLRAQNVLPNTFKKAQGNRPASQLPAERSKCTLSWYFICMTFYACVRVFVCFLSQS